MNLRQGNRKSRSRRTIFTNYSEKYSICEQQTIFLYTCILSISQFTINACTAEHVFQSPYLSTYCSVVSFVKWGICYFLQICTSRMSLLQVNGEKEEAKPKCRCEDRIGRNKIFKIIPIRLICRCKYGLKILTEGHFPCLSCQPPGAALDSELCHCQQRVKNNSELCHCRWYVCIAPRLCNHHAGTSVIQELHRWVLEMGKAWLQDCPQGAPCPTQLTDYAAAATGSNCAPRLCSYIAAEPSRAPALCSTITRPSSSSCWRYVCFYPCINNSILLGRIKIF